MDFDEDEYWAFLQVDGNEFCDDFGVPEAFVEEEEVFASEEQESTRSSRKKHAEKYLAKCLTCQRMYKTLKGYSDHLQTHKMSDAFGAVPDFQTIESEMPKIAIEVLNHYKEQVPQYGKGLELANLIKELISVVGFDEWKVFITRTGKMLMKCLPAVKSTPGRGKTFPMPTEVRCVFTKGCASVLTTSTILDISRDLSTIVCGVDEHVLQIFVSGFVRRLSDKLLSYIFRCMTDAVSNSVAQLRDRTSKSEQQMKDFTRTVHFIGGSVIRRIQNMSAPACAGHEHWRTVNDTINNCVLVGDMSEAPSEEDSSWTDNQNRGGLLNLSKNALNFFVCVGLICEEIEQPDRKITTEAILEKVLSSSTYQLWETVVMGTLEKTVSDYLMEMCCRYFCHTWGNGLARKRLNLLFKKGTTNIGLRSLVALPQSIHRTQPGSSKS